MKRYIYIAALVLATISMASCNSKIDPQVNPQPGYKTITLDAVAVQPGGESKTVIDGTVRDGKHLVKWEKDDKILVVDKNGKQAILSSMGTGESTRFSGEVVDDFGEIDYAFYPAKSYKDLNFTAKTVTLALEDNIETDIIGHTENPSFAHVDGEKSAVFKNICGILNVNILCMEPKAYDYKFKLKMKTPDNEPLSGNFKLEYGKDDVSLTPIEGSTKSELLLYYNNPTWAATPLPYYYILPAGSLSKGVILVARIFDNEDLTSGIKTTKNLSIEKGQIKAMPALSWSYDVLDESFYFGPADEN